MRNLFLILTLLIASQASSKDRYPMTHWIQHDYAREYHKPLSFDEAKKITSSIQCWSKANKLDPNWMLAIYTRESHFDPLATDGVGSYGIPQLQIKTAQGIVNTWGHNYTITPEVLGQHTGLAIRISCRYFRDLLNEFEGDYIKATRAYNAGEGNVKNGYWVRGKPCLPGINYFSHVLEYYIKIKGGEYGSR